MNERQPKVAAVDHAVKPGRIYVISAPSGAGKHTILKRALARDAQLTYCVSATTRPPRQGEVDGREYHFLDRATFERRAADGDFVEWAEVHGNLYGTLRSELESQVASGKDVMLELDVQGMRNVRRLGIDAVTVFIMPPTPESLEQRLLKRGTDSADVIAVRLSNSQAEMAAKNEYAHIIVNEDIEKAVADFEAIVREMRNERTNG